MPKGYVHATSESPIRRSTRNTGNPETIEGDHPPKLVVVLGI